MHRMRAFFAVVSQRSQRLQYRPSLRASAESNVALEIERKFLVIDDTWRLRTSQVIPMAQGYLNDQASMDTVLKGNEAQRVSVRVRLEGDDARLNFKSRDIGHTRQEFEYPIPVDDAHALLALCIGGRVEKRRHLVEHAGHVWEIDEFSGDNAGLVVAEIELASGDECFERPAWLGREVTDSARYYNLVLASRPYSQWSEAEKAATDLESSPCL
jgi:adenylate cyclase